MRISELEVGGERLVVLSAPVMVDEDALTDAEREVARRVVGGCTNAEVGAARGSSERTVANQLQSIYRKLGVSDRRELARRLAGG